MKSSTALAAGLTLLVATSAFAYPHEEHRHLGFYLHLDLGFGGFDGEVSEQDLHLTGPAGSFGIAIGGAIAENLLLSGAAWGYGSDNPNLRQYGVDYSTVDTHFVVGAVGPQLTYYFMPWNLYLSGMLGVSSISSREGGRTFNSEAGIGGQLAIGKEWWVSNDWGLGVAGQFFFSSNQDNAFPGSPSWGTGAVTIAFSVTYN